ncbi:hypothetical protein HNP99_003230 [Flavobacterium sp. 28A]|uniref:DUF6565 domain-containing protein n=1 Tax=Flavobacterium sp. 28A TaxID=2735895 RepID=UPI0015715BAB|nr:DUF6565 domain-containing protein [Flavobacterium sp. 28A]NRT16856.1 hypothetical protein [Flavobacterium sp. 28A]
MAINVQKGQNKNLITKWICLLAIICFSSCQSFKKESFLNNLESFVNEVELRCENYKENDWTVADKKYNSFIEFKYPEFRSIMTAAEISKANILFGKYKALKVKARILNFKQGLNDMLEQATSFTNEIASDSTLNNK